jgi:hypothetical protein
LEIDPTRVPDFVKRYGIEGYMTKTHEWLGKMGKGMVYVPTKNFMESCDPRFNTSVGPRGYSIGHVSMVGSGETSHVVICKDGIVMWDNGEERCEEYDVLVGYFVIYDLKLRRAKFPVKKDKKTKIANTIS